MLSSLSLSGYFTTWRIVPVRKWLGSPIYKPFSPIGRGPITLLRALILTMVISYWPLTSNGMILQVPSKFKKNKTTRHFQYQDWIPGSFLLSHWSRHESSKHAREVYNSTIYVFKESRGIRIIKTSKIMKLKLKICCASKIRDNMWQDYIYIYIHT